MVEFEELTDEEDEKWMLKKNFKVEDIYQSQNF